MKAEPFSSPSPAASPSAPNLAPKFAPALALAIVATTFAVLALAAPAAAWGPTGHMVVAELAHQHLSAEARAEADRLIAVLADQDPRFEDFVTASYWLDAVRARGWRSFDRWHYIDLPDNAEGLAEVPGPADDNAVEAVHQAVRTLEDPRAPDLAKAIMLRVAIHVVGDLHQPLHCVERYDLEHPQGDRGGNDFALPEADGGNLHRLWDSTLGLLPELPPTAEGRERVPALVAELVRAVPEDRLGEHGELDPAAWAREGFRLATTGVYAGLGEGRPVPDSYRAKGQLVVRRRLVLAGLRLAALLEGALHPPAAAANDGGSRP